MMVRSNLLTVWTLTNYVGQQAGSNNAKDSTLGKKSLSTTMPQGEDGEGRDVTLSMMAHAWLGAIEAGQGSSTGTPGPG